MPFAMPSPIAPPTSAPSRLVSARSRSIHSKQHGEAGQRQPEQHVDERIGTDGAEQKRRVRDRACKEQAGHDEPGHERTLRYDDRYELD